MDLIRWDPRDDFLRLRDEVNRLFDLPFRLWGREGGPWQPSIDVYETGDEVVVKAELPGIAPEDIDLRVTEEAVSLKGEMRQDQEERREGFYRRERRLGSFYRVVPLPAPVEPQKARATFRHGVLEVRAPKADDAHIQGYRVPIQEDPRRDIQ